MPPPLARDHMADWLTITCQCGASVDYPVRKLSARYGPDVDLTRAATRFSCRACHRRPEKVDLVDRPDHLGDGHGGGEKARVRRLA